MPEIHEVVRTAKLPPAATLPTPVAQALKEYAAVRDRLAQAEVALAALADQKEAAKAADDELLREAIKSGKTADIEKASATTPNADALKGKEEQAQRIRDAAYGALIEVYQRLLKALDQQRAGMLVSSVEHYRTARDKFDAAIDSLQEARLEYLTTVQTLDWWRRYSPRIALSYPDAVDAGSIIHPEGSLKGYHQLLPLSLMRRPFDEEIEQLNALLNVDPPQPPPLTARQQAQVDAQHAAESTFARADA